VQKEFIIPTSKITVNNLHSKYRYEFPEENISIIITGTKEAILKIKETDFILNIDVKGLYGGTQKVPLIIEGVDNTLFEEQKISVKLIWNAD
jgi:YbbR domain-containing protein